MKLFFGRAVWVVLVVLVALSVPLPAAFAHVDEFAESFEPSESAPFDFSLSSIPASERFKRTQDILAQFGVAPERVDPSLLDRLRGLQTVPGFSNILSALNPDGGWRAYADPSTDLEAIRPSKITFFQDVESRQVVDFDVYPEVSSKQASSRLTAKLKSLKLNPPDRPLLGLRVALDPGHMGGVEGNRIWDQYTGKFVKDSKGRIVSEGVIALQTAWLLERELSRLGATVEFTRRRIGPVSDETPETFDWQALSREMLRDSTSSAWFQKGLEGSDWRTRFSSLPQVKQIFNESRKAWNFVSRHDLEARVQKIRAFDPDLVLVIHYDMAPPKGKPTGINPRDYNAIKTYVAGSIGASQLSTREGRLLLAQHALDPEAFAHSIQLSSNLVQSLSSQLRLPLDPSSPGEVQKLAPGVFSRGLYLTRKLPGVAMSYLECLFYNGPTEFEAMLDARNPLVIDGQSLPYPDRVRQVAHALRDGVLNFVKSTRSY